LTGLQPQMTAADARDPFDLQRFVDAQSRNYDQALAEIRAGHKESHWMWYVFPQIAGLGSSPTSRRYAIRGRDEAAAYLAHPVLGPRLVACCDALLALAPGTPAEHVLGWPDHLKLRSSVTLFAQVSPPGSVFERVLERYFAGEPDAQTLQLLGA
jgi:uncharacterized protein (DUF1810 family)